LVHYVCRKGKYWSLEASVRVPGKKHPIKKRLAYFGTRRPSDPQARYEQMIATAERKGAEIDEAQKERYGETNAERSERLKEEAKFSPQKFLEATVTDEPAPAESEDACDAAQEEGPADAAEPGEPN